MKSRRTALKDVRFGSPRFEGVGIECLHLSELKNRVTERHLATPERVEFFLLLLVTEGFLRHTVDFADLKLAAGSLLFVRPGQVQHWHLGAPAQGCMVMIDPPALLAVPGGAVQADALLSTMEDWPVAAQLDDGFASAMKSDLGRLAQDLEQFDASVHDVLLVRQVLLGIMLRMARWHRVRWPEAPSREVKPQAVYRMFRRELERRFREHWTVAEFARRLGFSESTLNRACLTSAGQSAKVLVDRRVALEAARLLAHGRASATEVGHALGFTEPTNFVRFFTRMVGTSPGRFRLDQQAPGAVEALQRGES